jgi:osmoprotectant transport system ATP-binding protein
VKENQPDHRENRKDEEMVVFSNVSKVYGDGTKAVDELDLVINKGELVSLIGPSGCGKTTTLKMVNRLEDCTFGKIYLGGKDITSMDPVKLRRGIGYVVQEIALMPHMSVAENIAMVPKLHKWSRKRMRGRVEELLAMSGLEPAKYSYRLPDQLSGGQKQRIGVLRALAAEPEVILMDEPFGALDPISRDVLQNELLSIQQKLHKTIIFVTHDMDEALKISDRIVIMRDGKIEQIGTPTDIQENPKTDFVRNFIGEDRLSQISPDDSVSILVEDPWHRVTPDSSAREVLDKMENADMESIQVIDKDDQWIGMALLRDVKRVARVQGRIREAATRKRKLYIEEATMRDAAEMLADKPFSIPVIDKDRLFIGVITEAGVARLTIGRLKRPAGGALNVD